jgi:hypothetical protein
MTEFLAGIALGGVAGLMLGFLFGLVIVRRQRP